MKRTLAEHLEFASRLFDVGEIVKAGQMWQAILKKEPSSAEAMSGLARVREAMAGCGGVGEPVEPDGLAGPWSLAGALGLPHPQQLGALELSPPQAGPPAPPQPRDAPPAPPPADPQFDAHLRKGCSLYDKGDPRGALQAWERALALDPGSALAISYIRGVRRELGLSTLEMPPLPAVGAIKPPQGRVQAATAQSPPAPRHADEVERLLQSGVKSFEKGRLEKALQDWEKAYALDPENGLTKGYLGLVRNEVGRPTPPPTRPARAKGGGPQGGSETTLGAPRASIKIGLSANADDSSPSGARRGGTVQAPANIVRGPVLDRRLELKKDSASPVWRLLGSRLAVGALIVTALLVAAVSVVRNVRKDALLAAARTAIREDAIKRAEQSIKTERLMPTVDELCQDARSLMHSDPLAAYLLADEALKRDRMDASAPKLMEEARQAMMYRSAPPPSGNYAKLMAAGDLEGAADLLEAQLRRNPNDRRTRENLARVSLLMARAFAANGNWEGARTRIMLGSALFPSDLEWQARLRLLDYLRAASEDERRLWIGLLG